MTIFGLIILLVVVVIVVGVVSALAPIEERYKRLAYGLVVALCLIVGVLVLLSILSAAGAIDSGFYSRRLY
jgi:hypothetical protein